MGEFFPKTAGWKKGLNPVNSKVQALSIRIICVYNFRNNGLRDKINHAGKWQEVF